MGKKFKIIIIIIFIFPLKLFVQQQDDIINRALFYENNGDINSALKLYNEYLTKNKNDEKIQLKVIRLTHDYEKKVNGYKNFLTLFPTSRFRFIARVELAHIYVLKNRYNDAIEEFTRLKDISKGNEYYYLATYSIATLYLKLNQEEKALKELTEIIDDKENTFNRHSCYYLTGLIYSKKKSYDQAEKNLIFSIKNFGYTEVSPQALYELVKIYISQGKKENAEKYASILVNNFPGSYESTLVKENIKEIQIKNEMDDSLFLNAKYDDQRNRVDTDFKLSQIDNKNLINPKYYYIQLAYLSNMNNAKAMLSSYKNKTNEDIFIAKTKSKNSGSIFYRILIGPFFNYKEAQNKKDDLKNKNIESTIMELVREYE